MPHTTATCLTAASGGPASCARPSEPQRWKKRAGFAMAGGAGKWAVKRRLQGAGCGAPAGRAGAER